MFDFKWKENGSIKLLIIVGTRPEIIRLAATIKRCREYFDCCVAHTGQNYDKNLNDIFWSDFELGGPDVWMNVVGENLGQTCGNVIARSYELMAEIKPSIPFSRKRSINTVCPTLPRSPVMIRSYSSGVT